VKNGQTGLLFPEATAASLADTLRNASTWRFDADRYPGARRNRFRATHTPGSCAP
jgi:hypothetical protein